MDALETPLDPMNMGNRADFEDIAIRIPTFVGDGLMISEAIVPTVSMIIRNLKLASL